MAIIKCPECGRQISDKAPTCPNCGVEIAGKVIKCPHCGEVYFSSQEMCPNCHEIAVGITNPAPVRSESSAVLSGSPASVQSESSASARPGSPASVRPDAQALGQQEVAPSAHSTSAVPPVAPLQQESQRVARPATPPTPPPAPSTPPTSPQPPVPPVPPVRRPMSSGNDNDGRNGNTPDGQAAKKKNNRSILIISFIFAVLVCGIMYYFYDSANRNKELEAYEYAMQSSDPMVLQSYLDTYKDADEAHRDSIMAHLDLLKQTDQDWTNAVVSGSKEALEAYLQKYPNSPHKQEVWNKIDSIDWNVAKAADNVDAYQAYLDAHTDGAHIEEAENALKKAKSRDLQPEEKQMVSGLFRQFFQSINSHNADGLTATCEDILSSLLGKSSATKADVVTFMDKLYKDNVANMNWHINNDYQIKKREVGEEDYEYQVQFSARQDLDLTDGSKKENLFKISAVVSPAGKVSSFNMNKISVAE